MQRHQGRECEMGIQPFAGMTQNRAEDRLQINQARGHGTEAAQSAAVRQRVCRRDSSAIPPK